MDIVNNLRSHFNNVPNKGYPQMVFFYGIIEPSKSIDYNSLSIYYKEFSDWGNLLVYNDYTTDQLCDYFTEWLICKYPNEMRTIHKISFKESKERNFKVFNLSDNKIITIEIDFSYSNNTNLPF